MTNNLTHNAHAIGSEIAKAEIAALVAKQAARSARINAIDQTRRIGAYVALGKAIVRCLLLQVREEEIKALIVETRRAAILELTSSRLTSGDVTSRMKTIDKGISRARVSAEERVSGRTKAWQPITVPMITNEADYTSTMTEADRLGHANAKVKKSSYPALATRLVALNAIAEDVRTCTIATPGFEAKLRLLLSEIEKLANEQPQ